MAETGNPQVTNALMGVASGDKTAADRLLPLLYDELRALARRRLAHEPPGHTLQTTALVHEAYLRLVGDENAQWANRAHFFAAAARAMRRILVEQARRRRSRKRGGDHKRIALEALPGVEGGADIDLLALDESLSKLEAEDPRLNEIIMLRHFAGLTVDDTAAALGVSPRTIDREWRCARAWLYTEMIRGDSAPRGVEDGRQRLDANQGNTG